MSLFKSFLIGFAVSAALFFTLPHASAQEVECSDNIDNDADGYADCLDADCAATRSACYSCCMEHTAAAALQAETVKAKYACLAICQDSQAE